MNEWQPPYPYYDEDEPTDPITFVRETLEWIARPHGLTAKRCPKDERLREAEDMATAALDALRVALEDVPRVTDAERAEALRVREVVAEANSPR